MANKKCEREIDRTERDLRRRKISFRIEQSGDDLELYIGNATEPVRYDKATGAAHRAPRPPANPDDYPAEDSEFRLR